MIDTRYNPGSWQSLVHDCNCSRDENNQGRGLDPDQNIEFIGNESKFSVNDDCPRHGINGDGFSDLLPESRPVPTPDTSTIANCLGWLVDMDRNGLWAEYLENFEEASAEHGALVLGALQEIIAEMLE